MSWQVVDHVTIYREEGMYGAHPNVLRTQAGELLALFHRSPFGGCSHHAHPLFDVRACRSADEGQTWSNNGPVTLPLEMPAHLAKLRDGSVLLTYGVRHRGLLGVCARLRADE